ncbi:T9SS type A sorting domain-containing protein [Marinilabilia rubra]|uniref:Secretion system C-terminal sorting domain-containing protein n=1 Tax=Marinilabilia rubra TaxID=2162893 RepID=A0A2U2B8H8_9BACT|nr:T9SS type A sorting domain-containing protein [Marinilabilia rubra]PWD99346.1 hypothetical protein DDZ16_10055 [Marinilabilia rubra]
MKQFYAILVLFMCVAFNTLNAQPRYVENFELFPQDWTTFSDGSFVGNNDVTWTYKRARKSEVIDGTKGINLKNNYGEVKSSTLGNGLKSLSFVAKPVDTNSTADRTIIVRILDGAGVTKVTKNYTYVYDASHNEVQFTIDDINLTGDCVIWIMNTSATSADAEISISDLVYVDNSTPTYMANFFVTVDGVAIGDASLVLNGFTYFPNDFGVIKVIGLITDNYAYTVSAPGCYDSQGSITIVGEDINEGVELQAIPTAANELSTELSKANVFVKGRTITVDVKEQVTGHVYVYSVSGNLIAHRQLHSNSIDIPLSESGLYIVRVVSVNNFQQIDKVVIR